MPNIKTITCLKELEEKGELEQEDIVEFTIGDQIIRHKVKNIYLHNIKSASTKYNDEIFKVLEIDKWKIAEKIYKYRPTNKETHYTPNQWPEIKVKDYTSLTRLVKELYMIIKEKETVYTKFTRFEIIEI